MYLIYYLFIRFMLFYIYLGGLILNLNVLGRLVFKLNISNNNNDVNNNNKY